jgi:uncharacterized membrane-anchored protein
MSKINKFLIVANLAALFLYFGYTVCQKERLLEEGTLLLLKLAPADPRSLMQGDYMALRYAYPFPDGMLPGRDDTLPRRGFCVVEPDHDGVAAIKRFQAAKEPLSPGEYLIAYTRPDYRIRIGAESFFFQEGTASFYEKAEYGGLKVDNNGNSLLIGLFDDQKKRIIPAFQTQKSE